MRTLLLPLLIASLAGCDQLGLETAMQQNERFEAEGRAIGGACRHSGRALEDCYQVNPKASKSAIYNGWRDFDAYMRDNKIEEVKPEFPLKPPEQKKGKKPAEGGKGGDKAEAAAGDKVEKPEKAH